VPAGNTGPQPSLFATRPLPESPAAAYNRTAERAAENPGPIPPQYAATQTAAYGQPSYAASPPTAPPSRATKARKTVPVPVPAQVPGQTANWQAALPVAPWSAYERKSGGVAGLETETVLRSDLKSLKRSRTRARVYLATVAVIAAAVIHFGLRTMEQNATRYNQLRQSHEALRAQLGGAGSMPDLSRQPMRQGSRPAPLPSVAAPTAMGGGGPTASARALAEDLKRQMVGDTAVSVEARGDRVIIGMDDAALFTGNGTEVGQPGYRMLFRFGKAIKNVRDRRVVVSVIANEGLRNRPWIVAAARGISLGRFLLDDLSLEPNRVVVATPAPRPIGRAAPRDRVEFALEPSDGSRS
jgi:hypothetical protein